MVPTLKISEKKKKDLDLFQRVMWNFVWSPMFYFKWHSKLKIPSFFALHSKHFSGKLSIRCLQILKFSDVKMYLMMPRLKDKNLYYNLLLHIILKKKSIVLKLKPCIFQLMYLTIFKISVPYILGFHQLRKFKPKRLFGLYLS